MPITDRNRHWSLKQWTDEAQKKFNRWVRLRDADKIGMVSCITCSRRHRWNDHTRMNAGHCLTVGARPRLRFHERNCHGQCVHCNKYNGGRIDVYRTVMVVRYGINIFDELDEFERTWEPPQGTTAKIAVLSDVRDRYKALAAELEGNLK